MKQYIGADIIRQEIPDILHDESRFESGTPSAVYFPESVDDVKKVLAAAVRQGKKCTIIGARTGTTGGAVPEEGTIAVSFSSMKRIRAVESEKDGCTVLVCEPGITLAEIDRFLKAPAEWEYFVPGAGILGAGSLLFYPPDPTEMTAQLGGTVATNASGARSYHYGATRRHIAFLELLLANGETVTLRRQTANAGKWDRNIVTDQGTSFTIPSLPYEFGALKNACGYYNHSRMEAVDLFIGSEGTLAIITGIGVYLSPAPVLLSGLTFFPSKEAAFDFADFLRNESSIAAIEFFDEGSLRFIDHYRNRIPDRFPPFPADAHAAVLWEFIEETPGSFEERMERWEEVLIACGTSFESTWSGFDETETERLHHFRHALPETVNSIIAENKRSCSTIRKIGTDSAFPAQVFRQSFDTMMELIRSADLVHAAFGHLGDYHIHVNLVPADAEQLERALEVYDEMMALAVRCAGTVSAEHGVGKIKRKYLGQLYGIDGVAAMVAIKKCLDPDGILNPGNLFL